MISQLSSFANQVVGEFNILHDELLQYIEAKLNEQIRDVIHGYIDKTIDLIVRQKSDQRIGDILEYMKQERRRKKHPTDPNIYGYNSNQINVEHQCFGSNEVGHDEGNDMNQIELKHKSLTIQTKIII